MNYHQPRTINEGPNEGKWHYTCRNDDRIWPEGYCGRHRDCPDCGGDSFHTVSECATCDNKGVIELPEVERCQGHNTPEEARQHMTDYVLDTGIELDHSYSNVKHKCEVEGCAKWTEKFAEVRGPWISSSTFDLCYEHRTEAKVRELFGGVSDCVSS